MATVVQVFNSTHIAKDNNGKYFTLDNKDAKYSSIEELVGNYGKQDTANDTQAAESRRSDQSSDSGSADTTVVAEPTEVKASRKTASKKKTAKK